MSEELSHSSLITARRFFDSVTGSTKENQAILVEGGRIRAVGPWEQVRKESPPNAECYDLGDTCVAPGLIDSHTHLSLAGDGRVYADMFTDTDEMMVLTGAMNMKRHLDAGITTIREHGARNKVGFALKEGLARGYIPGPRMHVSGRPITCTGGHFHFCNEVADGEHEIRRSVRRLVHEGADYIKIMASGGGTAGTIPGAATYTTEELHAAVHEAHYFHRLTVAHCRAKDSMVRAVEAGVDLMEHAEFLEQDGEMHFDPKIAEMMAESGIWVSPTLQTWTKYPRIVALRNLQESDITDAEVEELGQLEARAKVRLDIMRKLLEYGIQERVVPGTDSGVNNIAFGHLDYDLRLLVEVGFTPAEALVSATRISAEAMGIEAEIGTIEPGKIADLVAFRGDPSSDVSACSEVAAIFQAGERIA